VKIVEDGEELKYKSLVENLTLENSLFSVVRVSRFNFGSSTDGPYSTFMEKGMRHNISSISKAFRLFQAGRHPPVLLIRLLSGCASRYACVPVGSRL
jgi:hypothetical protein